MPESWILICPECKTRNRIPDDRRDKEASCAKCRAALDTTGFFTPAPLEGTDGNFHDVVEQAPTPVLVDFWASWCGPCKGLAPVLDAIARELAGKIRVVTVNVDQNPHVASRFGVRSVPTLMIFYRGKRADTLVGAQPKATLLAKLAPYH